MICKFNERELNLNSSRLQYGLYSYNPQPIYEYGRSSKEARQNKRHALRIEQIEAVRYLHVHRTVSKVAEGRSN